MIKLVVLAALIGAVVMLVQTVREINKRLGAA